jgi:superoxide dismutase, Cu-Zn family
MRLDPASALVVLIAFTPAAAQDARPVVVKMAAVTAQGTGKSVGSIALSETERGLQLDVKINGLPAGEHGFHVHENASCAPGEKNGKVEAALGAGNHFDPDKTEKHAGPTGDGHRGDLPILTLQAGETNLRLTAPRLTLSDVKGRSLIIHEGSDTFADIPESGGGAGRIACGIIP